MTDARQPPPKIGVLALQGAFLEHINQMARLPSPPVIVEIRENEQLDDPELDALIIPGGESTTMALVGERTGMLEKLRQWVALGKPVWGTCAGTIFLARHATHTKIGGQQLLNVMDIEVDRNFFGRQVNSFRTDVVVPAVGEPPFNAVFIRAPMITDVGAGVEVLAELPESAVPPRAAEARPKRLVIMARQGHMVASVFHPELTPDARLHQYFLDIVVKEKPQPQPQRA